MDLEYKRNDIWIADLSGAVGNEQHGIRPVLIVSNDKGNRFSPTCTIAVISSSTTKSKLPTHVFIKAREDGMERDSVVMCESLRTVDKWVLMNKVATLTEDKMKQVDYALDISLDRVRDRK